MGDDISAIVRLGMAILILAAEVTAVITLFSTVNITYTQYMDDIAVAVSDTGDSSLAALNQERRVPAPVVYKIVLQNIDKIDSLSIAWSDGTVTADYKTLLSRASSFVSVKVESRGNGVSAVDIAEVVD